MKAIINDRGRQYIVKEGDIVSIDRMEIAPETTLEFDRVMSLIESDSKVKFGKPYIENAKVTAKVVENKRDDKVLVFKFKRRKNYKRLKGHKQEYTIVKIEKITA